MKDVSLSISEQDIYPFDVRVPPHHGQKPLVKRKLQRGQGQLERIRMVAALKHDCLIGLSAIHQEGKDYYALFQYVPQSLQAWSSGVSREFIDNYEQRIILFSRFLAEKGIVFKFRKENMGVSASGEAKYYLDLSFTIEPQLDKLALKKRYKQQIRSLIQVYIDKKSATTTVTRPLPESKKDSKVLKILQAIEKGKASLAEESKSSNSKQNTVAVQSSQGLAFRASPRKIKTFKNTQNLMIAKQLTQASKVTVLVKNTAVQQIKQEMKRSYASSSFYINGLPTVKLQKEGEVRRLMSPENPSNRFQEVNYKEYKTIKASGEQYVQDFISVLEGDTFQRLSIAGSPKAGGFSPRTSPSPDSPLCLPIIPEADSSSRPRKGAVQTDRNNQVRTKTPNQNSYSDTGTKSHGLTQKAPQQGGGNGLLRGSKKQTEIQQKVSQAIANSISAINKFKSNKSSMLS